MRLALILLSILAVVTAILVALVLNKKLKPTVESPEAKSAFTIGPETTVVGGPVDSTGRIQYDLALNEITSRGVTPESNAAVALWRVLGSAPEGTPVPAEYYRRLGIDVPPAAGALDKLKTTRDGFQEKLHAAASSPWIEDVNPVLAAALKTSDKPLELVRQAVEKPHFFVPCVGAPDKPAGYGMYDGASPHLFLCTRIALAFAAQAMLHVGHGRFDEALRELRTCHRLAELLGRGPFMIDVLVMAAIESITLKAELGYLQRVAADPVRLADFRAELNSLSALPRAADKMDLGERFIMLDAIMMLDRHGMACLPTMAGSEAAAQRSNLRPELLVAIDWDPALRARNQHVDRIVAAMNLPTRSKRVQALTRLEQEAATLRGRVRSEAEFRRASSGDGSEKGEFVGMILTSLEYESPFTRSLEDSAIRITTATDRVAQMRANLELAAALEAFRNETGRFPFSLSELVPKHLSKPPIDLFSGKPLIYRREAGGCRFHSVGPNGKDDNGALSEDGTADDIGIVLPARP